MQQRLQKCISEAGVASRRTAEAMISAGRVTVNGRTAQLGAQADPETDVICIDGRPLPPRAPKRYIMLNKPRGYVTTMHDERGRKTVLTAWRDRKQEEITHPYLGEKIQVGLIAYVQAMMLARVLRGDLDCYPPFVWR